MRILYLYSPVKTGYHNLTTTCPVRPLRQANFSVSPPYNSRIPPVSHCWSGSGRILFLHGRRLSHCVRNCDFCGTTGIICQQTRMEWYGGRGAPIVLNFNYLVPKAGRQELFLAYHASLFGGHLGRNRTLARLSHRFYWSGMADDVGDWLRQCTTCMKRKSPTGRHHGSIPTGHWWNRIAMDILDVCEPTPDGYRYVFVIADYFSKWTEAFPIKDKCADTVADVLVNKIILRFGMPLVIHSDQGREFENGFMKSLC